MSELRQNLVTKEWVIISPERARKPNAVLKKLESHALSNKEYEPECPFCPGNEGSFDIVEKYRIDDKNGNWVVRIIDNKYKVLDVFATCPLVPDSFERGTRIQVNTVLPNESARMLRECKVC